MKNKVLVVDDSLSYREIHQRLLREVGGYMVTTASDGLEAERIFRGERFDLVVTDLHMGEKMMDGLQLASILYELDPTVPIVLVTADPPTQKPRTISRVITKPVKREDFKRLADLLN